MIAHFSTHDDDGNNKLRPIVIWIATHPSTSSMTAESAHNVSPEILSLLKANGGNAAGGRRRVWWASLAGQGNPSQVVY